MNKEDYILKSKITKILGLEDDSNEEVILTLIKTIVDENNRLEDIEDRKVQIEYNNVFNKGAISVKTKLQSIIRDYTTPKDNNHRYLNYNNVEPLLNKLEDLIHGKEY